MFSKEQVARQTDRDTSSAELTRDSIDPTLWNVDLRKPASIIKWRWGLIFFFFSLVTEGILGRCIFKVTRKITEGLRVNHTVCNGPWFCCYWTLNTWLTTKTTKITCMLRTGGIRPGKQCLGRCFIYWRTTFGAVLWQTFSLFQRWGDWRSVTFWV